MFGLNIGRAFSKPETNMEEQKPNTSEEQWDDRWFNEEDDEEEDEVEQEKLVKSFANQVMRMNAKGTLQHAVGEKIHSEATQRLKALEEKESVETKPTNK